MLESVCIVEIPSIQLALNIIFKPIIWKVIKMLHHVFKRNLYEIRIVYQMTQFRFGNVSTYLWAGCMMVSTCRWQLVKYVFKQRCANTPKTTTSTEITTEWDHKYRIGVSSTEFYSDVLPSHHYHRICAFLAFLYANTNFRANVLANTTAQAIPNTSTPL